MRRYRIVSCLLLTVLLLTMTGCTNAANHDVEEKSPMNLTFIGASATGPGAIIMNGLSECVNKSYPDSIVTVVPGNFGTNVTRINNGEADAAITDSYFALAALSGKEPFEGKMDNVASVVHLYPSSILIIASKDSGIKSFDDFVNNQMPLKINAGLAGGSSDICFQQLLAEYGYTYDDVTNWGGEVLFQNIEAGVQMIADGRIDAMVMRSFVPTPNIQELSRNKEILIMEVNAEVRKSMCEKYGYNESMIKAGSYDFIKEDLPCINSNSIFIVPQDSSEENVYKITRAINENLDYLKVVHSSMADATHEDLASNLGIPLHPGAEKYYREKGIIK